MTRPDPLGPSRRCPRAGRCEACGTTRRLEVATYQTPVRGVLRHRLRPLRGRQATRRRCAPGLEAFERVGAHCEHLGIDLDQMAALLHREREGGGDGRG